MAGWQRARIIPVSGIANDTEAEQRATSALLAVLSIVRPFSKAVLTPMGVVRQLEGTSSGGLRQLVGTRLAPVAWDHL